MKNWKKHLLLILAFCLVLFAFASCKPGNQRNYEEDEDDYVEVEADDDNEDTYEFARSLIPEVDFEGREFRILICKSVSNFDVQNGDLSRNVVAKGQIGVEINDQVYNRNLYLEKKLGITIRAYEKPFRAVADELKASILAMDDRYDICYTRLDDLTPLASEGLLVNLYELEEYGVDFSRPWWDQNSIDELSIQGELFFAVSDGDIVDKQTTMACMFNKSLMDEHRIEYPYETASAGEWTIDLMMDMANQVKKDADGNGIYNASDVWGVLTEYDSATCFYYAFGGYVTTKNNADEPVLAMQNPAAQIAIDKALSVMQNNDVVYKAEQITGGTDGIWVTASNMFVNNQALFRITNLTTVERWRNMKADFGILPMPKLNTEQKNYVHLCKNGATGVCVPNTNENLDFTAICLEAFVSCSRYTLRSAYYETTLEGMVSRDLETPKMLDIIFSTRAFDLGYIFNFGHDGSISQGETNGTGIGYLLMKLARSNSTAFASSYDSIKDKAQAQIDDMLSTLERSREV